jgi:hypothetical protein
MKGVKSVLLLVLLCTVYLAAQEPPAYVDLTLSSSEYGWRFVPLGTTVDDNIVLFYTVHPLWGGNRMLKSCVISPTGALGPLRVLATPVDLFVMDAVWHPAVKRFMVVYISGTALYARSVRADGSPGGPAVKVNDYDGDYVSLAYTNKRKFVLFIARDGQVVGQVLKKNGKKFKSEIKLTNFTGTVSAYPVDAATKADGNAVAYYASYDYIPDKLTPSLLSVDHKLNVLEDFEIASGMTTQRDQVFVGAYDPNSRTHAVAWDLYNYPANNRKYCCVDESGATVMPPTALPKDVSPESLVYDPSGKRFALLYRKHTINASDEIEYTRLYLFIFNPKGKAIDQDFFLLQIGDEEAGLGLGCARNGNILGAASTRLKEPVIKARLIY